MAAARPAALTAPEYTTFAEPSAGFQPVYSLIESARHSLDMTMYELVDPTAEHDLAADAKRGVDVRVFLDSAYSGGKDNQAAAVTLKAAGVHVEFAPSSLIVHQKTITVDNHTSDIMTANLTSEYYSTTADFVVQDSNPADVATVVQAFNDDWGGDLAGKYYDVPIRGLHGNLIFSPESEDTLVGLIESARHTLQVSNEEMDSKTIEKALESAARRGADVQVLMTKDSSWDTAFTALKDSGVHIRLYPDSEKDLYVHAKSVVADGTTAYVGSINFSTSSTVYNRELGLLTTNPAVVQPVVAAWSKWWAAAPIDY